MIKKSPFAEKDLDEIWDYIARDSPERATKFLRSLNEKLNRLSKNPLMGRARNEIDENLRSFPYGNYIIFYTPITNGIDVIRILHCARDYERIFGKE